MVEVNGWVIEKIMRPIFRKFSIAGNKAYFDKGEFPVTAVLEKNYPAIKLSLIHI